MWNLFCRGNSIFFLVADDSITITFIIPQQLETVSDKDSKQEIIENKFVDFGLSISCACQCTKCKGLFKLKVVWICLNHRENFYSRELLWAYTSDKPSALPSAFTLSPLQDVRAILYLAHRICMPLCACALKCASYLFVAFTNLYKEEKAHAHIQAHTNPYNQAFNAVSWCGALVKV